MDRHDEANSHISQFCECDLQTTNNKGRYINTRSVCAAGIISPEGKHDERGRREMTMQQVEIRTDDSSPLLVFEIYTKITTLDNSDE